jgi:hypothetical protein
LKKKLLLAAGSGMRITLSATASASCSYISLGWLMLSLGWMNGLKKVDRLF